jgi:hypothetical protein
MHYIILFVAIGLLGFYSTGHSAEISAEQLSRINSLAIVDNEDAHDLVAYIKSLWTQRELDCQGPKHMQCM